MKMAVIDYIVRDALEEKFFNAPVNLDTDPVEEVIDDMAHEKMLLDFVFEK